MDGLHYSPAVAQLMWVGKQFEMRLWLDSLWIIIGAAVMLYSFQIGLWKGAWPGPGFFPLMSGVLMVLGGAAALSTGRSEVEIRRPSRQRSLVIAATFATSCIVALMASWLGFFAACVIGAPALMVVIARRWSIASIPVGLAFGYAVYAVFAYVLQLPLPRGALGL